MAEDLPPLGDAELAALREIGGRWRDSIPQPEAWLRALPIEPEAIELPTRVVATRRGRVIEVRPEADRLAERSSSRWARVRRVLVGHPLTSSALVEERMRKLIALPVISADLFASVAYGPESLFAVLALGGTVALGFAPAVGAVLVLLMLAVGLSYRQTLRAYPSGAGSYVVARENLGTLAGLAAGVGLLADYVLNVAVSIATGVAAATSALPVLGRYSAGMGLAMFAILLVGNLRGVRQAGAAFAAPTYIFIAAIALLVAVGLAESARGGFKPAPAPPMRVLEPVTLVLLLRAFANGATAMTGIEAVSNAIPAFRPPEDRNARTVLTWMIALLVALFAGLMTLLHLDGIAWRPDETLLSQLGHHVFGGGPPYLFIQAATFLMLLFGANTSYNGLPRLLFTLARDYYAPRPFLRLGDRLAFSNGVIVLTAVAAAVYLGFGGRLESLIPLFAVGVFLAFTLSQAGMVAHWWRRRERGWRTSLLINAVGAFLSAAVLVTAACTKFLEGAWVVVLGVPMLMWLAMRIRRHYEKVAEALKLRHPEGTSAPPPDGAGPVAAGESSVRADAEAEVAPSQVRHLTVVPVSRLDLANLRALAYAAALRQPVMALHISPVAAEAELFRKEWMVWGNHLPLVVVMSPFRTLVPPLLSYIHQARAQAPDLTLTVVVPELIVPRPWQRLLHNNLGARLRRSLRAVPGLVICSVPVHLPR